MSNTDGRLSGFENRAEGRLPSLHDFFAFSIPYIHENPVKAGIVASPQEYGWSFTLN
jgi:hypothetical protein